MAGYVLRRVCESGILLLIMSFVIFCMIGLMPGDPIDIMVNSNPGYTAADVARLRALYGLDQPLLLRYWHWLAAALTLDFGFSRTYSQPVFDIMGPALAHTAKLMGLSFVFFSVTSL